MQIPKPFRTVGNVVLVFFAVVGGIMSLAQLPAIWQASDTKSVTLLASDTVLVTQGEFADELSYAGAPIGSRQIVETTITLWRDGGAPISSEMIRRPLEIKLPPGSTVAGARIVDQDSSIKDNFALDSNDNTVSLKWKIFDPDMAVKVAIARFGSSDPVQVSESLGPGVTTTYSRYNLAKSLYWWGMILLGGAVVIPMFFVACTVGVDVATSLINRLTSSLHLAFRVPAFLIGLLLYGAAALGVPLMIASGFAWLIDSVVPPIPFS